jgi:hypothetical protein
MRLGIALAFGLLFVLAWVFFAGPTEEDADRLSRPQDSTAREAPVLRGSDPSERAPGADAETNDPLNDDPEKTDAASAPLACVQGTLLERRPDGRQVPVARGGIRFGSLHSGDPESVSVEVRDGRWSAEIPPGMNWQVRSITIDGRLAALDSDSPSWITTKAVMEEVALLAEVVRPMTLRVVDADTGRDLTGLIVVHKGGSLNDDLLHPGDVEEEEILLVDATSPVEVPIWDPTWIEHEAVVWASCDGYAWGRLVFDQVSGGERLLRLRRGGTLDVRLAGVAAADDMVLRLREDGPEAMKHSPVAEYEVFERTHVEVDRLSAGRYVGSVEIGRWFGKPCVVASGRFQIVAGERVELALELTAVERPVLLPVVGTIVIPEAWNLDVPVLQVEFRDSEPAGDWSYDWLYAGERLKRVPRVPDTWRFDAGPAPACTALFALQGTGFRTIVPIDAEGSRDLRIVVPPPCHVSVRVVDARTREDAPVDKLFWHRVSPSDRWGFGLESVPKDPASGRFDFRVPGGTVHLDLDGPWVMASDPTIEVAADPTEHTLLVEPAGSVLIVLMDAEARIPHYSHAELWRDGVDYAYCYADHDEGCAVWAYEPGRYRLHVPDVDGFEPIPDRDVEIERGKQTRVTINLIRSR